MKRLRFLFCLITAVTGIALIPQIVSAYTYPGGYWDLHPRNSLSFTIPALIIVTVLAVIFYFIFRNTTRGTAQGNLNKANAASLIQEKLISDEKPIRQISNKFSDFVITDKRLLRFSPGGFQALEYANISAVNYVSNANKKKGMVIILIAVMLGVFLFSAIMVSSAFDPNVMNVSKTDALLVTLMSAVTFWICILWLSVDYGYYQIERKVDDWRESWRIERQRSLQANRDMDEFVKTLKEQITAANK